MFHATDANRSALDLRYETRQVGILSYQGLWWFALR